MSEKLSPKQRRCIASLVENGSVSIAAQDAKCSRQTVYEWLKQDAFTAALREASTLQMESVSRELVALMPEAVAVYRELIDTGSEHQRRLAADSILAHGLKLMEIVEFESRIRRLEEMKNGNK